MQNYIRKAPYGQLVKSLRGRVNLIQAVIGPRQVGKTTLALQLFERWVGPKLYETADQPNIPSAEWISAHWEMSRRQNKIAGRKSLLILDEIQKIPNWSNVVKKLFDEDRRCRMDIRVILLGSSALLMQKGLTESLAGRFEVCRHNQWSFLECRECFSLSFDEYIYFGGYPGALALRKDEARWAAYIRDSLIETVLSKDILLLVPVSKPVLLRQAFGLAVGYPAQIMSYQKMLGSLQDAGNTTTIASYLHLLSQAFLLSPLERWSGSRIRQRGSIPKILIFDNGIISAMQGLRFKTVLNDKTAWGRLIENAVGAQLYFLAQKQGGELFYWRDRENEIDYVLKIGDKIKAIEVKSGKDTQSPAAFTLFQKQYKNAQTIVILESKSQADNLLRRINLRDFFSSPEKILE